MPSANTGSLRARRRAELLSQIQDTAHQLFAERGFAAVTTEDIAAAAGISISTYFRYAPTKEDLLVAPLRQAVAEVVAAYSARPSDESAAEALLHLFVENTRDRTNQKLEYWQQAILTAPHLLSESAWISENDDRGSSNGSLPAPVSMRPTSVPRCWSTLVWLPHNSYFGAG